MMMDLTIPLRYGTRRLADVPWVFDGLRWILEGGFRGHHQMLAKNFPFQPASVLDCGCGTGLFASCFNPRAYTGIDISRDYITRARALHRDYQFQVMDASELKFSDHCFEAVIVSGVLHHLDDQTSRQVLKEIHRVLQPGGRLLIWEDIPTRSRFNVLGQVVHRLDVGQYIRPADLYVQLIQPMFQLQSRQDMRSGCMDYHVMEAQPVAPGALLSLLWSWPPSTLMQPVRSSIWDTINTRA